MRKNQFSAGFLGFEEKKVENEKKVTVGQKFKMEILDRRWACLFGGRKRGRGAWQAGLGRGWRLRKPDFGRKYRLLP